MPMVAIIAKRPLAVVVVSSSIRGGVAHPSTEHATIVLHQAEQVQTQYYMRSMQFEICPKWAIANMHKAYIMRDTCLQLGKHITVWMYIR